jgi:hypothetical protein
MAAFRVAAAEAEATSPIPLSLAGLAVKADREE